jgi:hypothetical protein
MLLEILSPGSFYYAHGPPVGMVQIESQLIYFSFSTLTTVGFGDITPLTPPAKSFGLCHGNPADLQPPLHRLPRLSRLAVQREAGFVSRGRAWRLRTQCLFRSLRRLSAHRHGRRRQHAAWRERGFYPILARDGTAAENLEGLAAVPDGCRGHGNTTPPVSPRCAGRAAPGPLQGALRGDTDGAGAQLEQHPAVGMPFGLPAISEEDFATLKAWVAAGSPGPDEAAQQQAQQPANPEAVAAWEASSTPMIRAPGWSAASSFSMSFWRPSC